MEERFASGGPAPAHVWVFREIWNRAQGNPIVGSDVMLAFLMRAQAPAPAERGAAVLPPVPNGPVVEIFLRRDAHGPLPNTQRRCVVREASRARVVSLSLSLSLSLLR